MSIKEWECLEIYAKSLDRLNAINADIVKSMKKLKIETHLGQYFYNRYANSEKDSYFLKLGLVNADEQALQELNGILQKHGVVVKEYPCEMQDVDGVPMDKLKCISCEMFERVQDGIGITFSQQQAFYLLHFLMNQIGLTYEQEYDLYMRLAEAIKKQLGSKSY